MKHEIGTDIGSVQWLWPIGKPVVDGFGGGLYEVRTSYAGEQYRILFYIDAGQLVVVHGERQKAAMVLVHGIHKKTQQTPPAVIALARKRMKEGT